MKGKARMRTRVKKGDRGGEQPLELMIGCSLLMEIISFRES